MEFSQLEVKLDSIYLVLVILLTGAGGLRQVDLQVPAAVLNGTSATLLCRYDLEGDPLYTVKWYKGREEFFRYVPKEHPHTRVFALPGVFVDLSESGADRVTLRDMRRALTGRYRCEVTTDAPHFHTEIVSAQVQVLEVPEGAPSVAVEKSSYAPGDTLRANCSAPWPLNISWQLNGREVNESSSVELGRDEASNTTTVAFHAEVARFQGGKLRLECVARLFDVFSSARAVWLDEDRPLPASVLGTRQSSTADQTHCSSVSWLVFYCLLWQQVTT